MRTRGQHFLIVALALAAIATAAPSVQACDACSNNTCTPGFAQGTYGCTVVQASCTLIAQVFGTCRAGSCSTAGSPPCDNTKPPGKDPQKADLGPVDVATWGAGTCEAPGPDEAGAEVSASFDGGAGGGTDAGTGAAANVGAANGADASGASGARTDLP